MKKLLSVSMGLVALGVPAVASAQPQQGCPPGSWFCADAQVQPAAPAGQPVQPLQPLPPLPSQQPLPPPQAAPPAPPPGAPPPPPGAPPPIVLYQPPPPRVVVVQPAPPVPPPYVYRPAPPLVPRSEWGINVHLEGALIGRGQVGDAGMGGLGFGVRYKPIPYFAVEGALDFVTGTDYGGNHRAEDAFTLNGLVFLNPKSKVQVYLLAGFGWSGAHVSDNMSTWDYSYFGGQLGGGVEFRISRHFALNTDLRGFIRGRTDDAVNSGPAEFSDGRGHTSNTSGGGLLTGGATVYF